MIVRLLVFHLAFPEAQSLKDKRMVLRSVKDRLRTRFNVSVAETGGQDLWGRGELSVVYLSPDVAQADAVESRIDRLLDESGRLVISHTRREDL
ncbi:MAG: DUF503 domain-containing protein [Gemmatimonadota bacterium]